MVLRLKTKEKDQILYPGASEGFSERQAKSKEPKNASRKSVFRRGSRFLGPRLAPVHEVYTYIHIYIYIERYTFTQVHTYIIIYGS